jgi:molybdate transport system ATP-binding protein
MTLTARAELAARGLDVDLSLADGERVALVGANGSGKSSVLAVLAGIVRPDRGRAELDGRLLFDVGPQPGGRWTPPWRRGIALLAQDPLLFPHLSVLENVAFAPRAAGLGRGRARELARVRLAEVGAAEFAERRPAQLSGGEAQRVAIARALAADPRLLLLDEPMAALDVTAAPLLRRVLRRVLADRAAVVVTHDLLDAVLLCHRVVVLADGRVVESGPTAEVMRHPRTPFTARLAGLNLIRGRRSGDGVEDTAGRLIVGVDAAGTRAADGEPAVAAFGPAAVSVYADGGARPHGSPRNSRSVTITELEPREHLVRVRADQARGETLVADVTTQAVGDLDLYPGRAVTFTIKATAVTIYPA